MDKIEAFWQRFLTATNRDSDTTYIDVFHFELSERLANDLLDLVLKGIKRATASSLHAYEKNNEPVPSTGDLSIVTDWDGTPRCVIETTKVTILPYKDITYDICKREGEDDSLASWQSGHKRFYEEEGKQLGYTFDEEMDVVFEDFRVVYQENRTE